MNSSINYPKSGLLVQAALSILFFILSYPLVIGGPNLRPEGKEFVTKIWDNEHGLPVNSVFKIIQDKTGFLWISTEEGLVQFDGVNFTIHSDANTPQLNDSWFVDITNASDGGIWAVNASAIVHAVNGQLTIYDFSAEMVKDNISSIAEGPGGDVWVGTVNGKVFRFRQGELEPLPGLISKAAGAIKVIRRAPGGMIFGTESGLYAYQISSGTVQEVAGFGGLEIRSLAVHPDSSLWVGTRDDGILILQQGRVHAINTDNGLVNNHVNALHIADNGQVWAGMSIGGVQLINGREVISFSEEAFGYNEIRDILISSNGSVWLAVVGYGVVQMTPATISTFGTAEGLSSDITLAIYQDDRGVIWTGTAGAGVNRIEHGEVTHITKADGLTHGIVVGIYGVGDYLYFGTGDGLHLYHAIRGKMEKRLTTRDGLASNTVQAIYHDSRQRLWVATRSGGIHRLNNHHQVERLDVPEDYKETEFLNIFEDSKENIWIGTSSKGLLKIAPDDHIEPYPVSKGPSSEMALSVWEDPEGDIWAGTSLGLVVLSDDSTFRLFNQNNGLHFNGIFGMVEGDNGQLYLSGNFGIQQLSIKELLALKHDPTGKRRLSARLFDTSDGMANQEANGAIFPAGGKMKSGEIWFPTMGGIAIVNPPKIQKTLRSPRVHIRSLSYGSQKFDPVHGDVSVPPGVYNLEVRYGSLDFEQPHRINYSYRLKNVHEAWEEVGNRTTAYFSGLSPGDYLFEVKAEKFGASSEISSFKFTVEPNFYQTTWFRGIMVISLFLAGYFVSMLYSQRRLGTKLQQQVKSKTLELEQRNVMLEDSMKDVAKQNHLIKEVAWVQSHQLRGPLSKILGLMQVVKQYSHFQDVEMSEEQLLEEMEVGMNEIDAMLRSLNAKMEEIERNDVYS